MNAYPEHDQWAERVGETFTMRPNGCKPLRVELIDASPTGPTGPRPKGSPRKLAFSLVFREPKATTAVRQGTHDVDHDAFGTLPIFLVPIGPDDVGMRYQAVFN